MPHAFLKVALFVTVVVATFVFIGEALSDISGGGGGSAIAGEVSVAAGEALFWDKGKCYTCHSFGGEGSAVRCPNLGILGDQFAEPVAVRAVERGAERGMSDVEYLVESLYNPNVYLVAGFPRDVMTPINRPPIALSDEEIASVILYLRSNSGVANDDATFAAIRAAQDPFASGAVVVEQAAGFEFPEGDPEEGRYTYEDLKCYQCHRIGGIQFGGELEGGIGPDLTEIGSIQTRTYLNESMLVPDRIVVADPPGVEPGEEDSYRNEFGATKMPEFHDVMTVRQLLDVTAFLETMQGEEKNAELYDF